MTQRTPWAAAPQRGGVQAVPLGHPVGDVRDDVGTGGAEGGLSIAQAVTPSAS